MIINQSTLLDIQPIQDMSNFKSTDGFNISYGLTEAGYDICIDQKIEFKMLFGLIPVHRINNGRWKLGRFVLASSMERFQMPPSLVAVVHDKSTWARKGIQVFNTIVEPSWSGWLTLELVFNGNEPITIHKCSGIAQVIFHELLEDAEYTGKYQNQPRRPVEAITSFQHKPSLD